MEIIKKYFPELSNRQQQQFAALYDLYAEWNGKINVISRKDLPNLYVHHVLHSLTITLAIRFKPGTSILDAGTGGGFPGIPLAIFFPDVAFRLIDGTGKKIKVAGAIAQALELNNTSLCHERVEDEKGSFDFVVSRAVMPLDELAKIVRKNIAKQQKNALPNGLLCLKGGELEHELRPFKNIAVTYPLQKYFPEDYFTNKKIIYLPLS
ncbi:MAG: 16S rRNA (guanine(527)-N(7))-methyltransferase RsmG [Dysgonamonadaceae bacterium]|jgi:16S rRNA (guanine527-N7)-methyltransferase|nr:16S rRNA (guanine(527)-N(7))-methyltransferase RsmG [Dysgonamonadaceae bacterium]